MQYRSLACWDSNIESISSDHSAAYFRRKSKIDHPAGRFLLFSPPAVHGLFARARARELIARMNVVVLRLRDGIVIMSCTRRKVIS